MFLHPPYGKESAFGAILGTSILGTEVFKVEVLRSGDGDRSRYTDGGNGDRGFIGHALVWSNRGIGCYASVQCEKII